MMRDCVACCEPIEPGQTHFTVESGFGRGRDCHEGFCRNELAAINADVDGDEQPEPIYEQFGLSYKDWIR